jgi:mRNA interferase RelE/StbE
LAWTLEYEPQARRQLRRLDRATSHRIIDKLEQLRDSDNPRLRGIAMAGRYASHWRYRIGDYRVIAKIEDGRMVIVVVTVGHRREVYR